MQTFYKTKKTLLFFYPHNLINDYETSPGSLPNCSLKHLEK